NIHDAEDVVQEAFGRLLPQELDAIDDVRGWLVVVVSRICLDQLRSAHHRRETNTEVADFDRRTASTTGDPADRVTLADSIPRTSAVTSSSAPSHRHGRRCAAAARSPATCWRCSGRGRG